jgi:hypothetical protein
VYLLYPVLAVSAKVQLENKNLQNILTPKSCIHLKKDDSFSPGSSVVNIIVTILHFREQCRNNLVTVSFITSGLNVNMLYWCFSYGTGDGIVCWYIVILEASAKNSSRLKHCIEVCDTTHHCLRSCSCNIVHFVFDVEGRPSVITNHFRNFNLVSIGQSRFKYLSILFEIVLIPI